MLVLGLVVVMVTALVPQSVLVLVLVLIPVPVLVWVPVLGWRGRGLVVSGRQWGLVLVLLTVPVRSVQRLGHCQGRSQDRGRRCSRVLVVSGW